MDDKCIIHPERDCNGNGGDDHMIQFANWTISNPCGEVIARQYDNLSRTLTVMGDLPAGWDWSMLVESGGNLNIIALSPVEGGVGVTLTADMIPYAGYYRMQLRGTQGEAVRHTNIIQVYIPESLTGEGQWPDLPSEFEQIEERMQELAGQAQDSADAADTSAKAAAESAAAAEGAEESVAANAKSAQEARQGAQAAQQAIEDMTVSGETLEPGADATVTKTEQDGVVHLEFGIPQGATGAIPDITVGTVETLEPGQDATAEITGETPNLVLNLGIPKGQPGQDAPQIDDSRVSSANPWSSRQIVDTLAPEFESSGPVVTCNPVKGYPLHVVSQIVAVQSGSGDPSPDNVRPISGWAQATLTHNDTPITLPFGKTVYGGTLDWTTGVLTVGWISHTFNAADIVSENWQPTDTSMGALIRVTSAAALPVKTSTEIPNVLCTSLKTISYGDIFSGRISEMAISRVQGGADNRFTIRLPLSLATTAADIKAWLIDNAVKVAYQIAEPFTIQLTPTEVLALSGTNTIYADTGDTTVSGRADPNTILQQLAQRIAALEGQAING